MHTQSSFDGGIINRGYLNGMAKKTLEMIGDEEVGIRDGE